SSDVCSSDLQFLTGGGRRRLEPTEELVRVHEEHVRIPEPKLIELEDSPAVASRLCVEAIEVRCRKSIIAEADRARQRTQGVPLITLLHLESRTFCILAIASSFVWIGARRSLLRLGKVGHGVHEDVPFVEQLSHVGFLAELEECDDRVHQRAALWPTRVHGVT